MAANRQEQGLEETAQVRNSRLREALAEAHTALQGEKTVQSFSAFTFEEALDAQIERIEGAGTQLRPNELVRIDRILNGVTQAVAQIKSMPPEAFVESDSSADVNTPEDGEE